MPSPFHSPNTPTHTLYHYNCDNSDYERKLSRDSGLLEYNAKLEREAYELQSRILHQFEDYRLMIESQPECEFKQRYLRLLKKSQRRR
jgi:hypothetical protein